MLPFTEFYIVEYQNIKAYKEHGGVIIWHIDSNLNSSKAYKNKNYIKPIYKSGGQIDTYWSDTDFTYNSSNDMYLTGDIWSSTTSPSSDFYNGYKTGAYLEVLNMDEEKATVKVGFQDMGWEQPAVSVTGGYNEHTNSFTGQEEKYVYFSLSFDDAYTIMGNKPLTNKNDWKYLTKEVIDKYVEVSLGDVPVQINYDRCTLNGKNQVYIRIDGIDAAENEGAVVQLHLKDGSAINGFKKCEAASFSVEIPKIEPKDTTPPTVLDITYFPPWRTRGKVIAFFTADEEITPTEYVFTHNANIAGVSVRDLAGNKTYLDILKVNWIANFRDEDYKTLLPEGVLRYSTKAATNQDVTVRLEPLEDVNESSEELTYVFADNGEYTFTFTDKYGNVNTKTAVVDWIDKEPPEIVLNGESQIILAKGDSYTEQGAVATDNRDGLVDVTISGNVDTSQIGTYNVRYSAVDSLGNASEATRTVIVLESDYRITFKNYNGDILQNQNIRTNTIPEYTGETPVKPSDDKYTYTFSGWSPQITAVSGEAEYTAQFTAIPRVYNITLNLNGGTVENPITEYTYGTGVTLPVPTKTGYIFNGWYDDETCSGAAITSISATDTGDKAYYAKWTPNIYTVTYDYNEATGGNSVKTKTVVYDSEYGTLPTPSKIGCIFDGWNTADNVKVTSETIVSIAENHTLRAQWADCPHTWDSGKITKNATCTATGTALFTCTVCADTKTEEIAMLPHTEVTDAKVEPTCTEEGKTEGSHCSVCNTVIKAQEVISATGHTENSGEITKPPTCTETGMMTYKCTKCSEIVRTESISASGHVIDESEWYKDSENHWRECGVCHEKPEEETHIKDSGTVTKQPTTEENGIREYKCTVCGFVMQTEPIEKLDSPIEPSDRIEFERQEDGTILAKLIFEKTTPPKSDDITMYIAYYKDSKLMRVDIPLRTKMSALIDIDETLADCEIKVFVWDKNMKPLMEAQNIHK